MFVFVVVVLFTVVLQLCAQIDRITTGEAGIDAEILANIQQIAQKLFDNVRVEHFFSFSSHYIPYHS